MSRGIERQARARCPGAGAGRRKTRTGSAPCVLGPQSDFFQQRDDWLLLLGCLGQADNSPAARPTICAGVEPRIERGIRILEHHLHLAAMRAHRALAQAGHFGVAEPDAGRRSARSGAGWSCRPSICRIRIRRPGTAFRRRSMAKDTPSTALILAGDARSTPRSTGKYFFKFSTRSTVAHDCQHPLDLPSTPRMGAGLCRRRGAAAQCLAPIAAVGRLFWQRGAAKPQRGAKAQPAPRPAGGLAQRGHHALDFAQAPRSYCLAARAELRPSGRACRDAAGGRTTPRLSLPRPCARHTSRPRAALFRRSRRDRG